VTSKRRGLGRSRRMEWKLTERDSAQTDNPKPSRRKRIDKRERYDWQVDGVMVSDHAVVRYLETMFGIDMHEVRKLIVENGRSEVIRNIGTVKLSVGKGARLVARDGVVVTILKPRGEYDAKEEK
jgi:hypothetical protein